MGSREDTRKMITPGGDELHDSLKKEKKKKKK